MPAMIGSGNETSLPSHAGRLSRRDETAPSGALSRRREDAIRPAALLLIALLAAAQLWLGPTTATACVTSEDFPCGP